MTLCQTSILSQDSTWDCIPHDQREQLLFQMLVFLGSNVPIDCEVTGAQAPCEWDRFSDREKWSVILYALCVLADSAGGRGTCAGSTCASELPNDFLALRPDHQEIALMALVKNFCAYYQEGYDATTVSSATRCLTRTQRLNVLLQMALELLACEEVVTDPDTLMCGSTNPYWNVKLQDVPAWLFSLMCALYLAVTTPQ